MEMFPFPQMQLKFQKNLGHFPAFSAPLISHYMRTNPLILLG